MQHATYCRGFAIPATVWPAPVLAHPWATTQGKGAGCVPVVTCNAAPTLPALCLDPVVPADALLASTLSAQVLVESMIALANIMALQTCTLVVQMCAEVLAPAITAVVLALSMFAGKMGLALLAIPLELSADTEILE